MKMQKDKNYLGDLEEQLSWRTLTESKTKYNMREIKTVR